MKKIFTTAVAAIIVMSAMTASSQESNYNNSTTQYGPPNFTGGTVASPSDAYAASHDFSAPQEATVISSIFPVPAKDNLSVVLGQTAVAPVTMWIVNMNGEVLRAYHFDAGYNRLDIDVSSLAQGLYSIQVQEAGKSMQSIELAKRE